MRRLPRIPTPVLAALAGVLIVGGLFVCLVAGLMSLYSGASGPDPVAGWFGAYTAVAVGIGMIVLGTLVERARFDRQIGSGQALRGFPVKLVDATPVLPADNSEGRPGPPADEQ